MKWICIYVSVNVYTVHALTFEIIWNSNETHFNFSTLDSVVSLCIIILRGLRANRCVNPHLQNFLYSIHFVSNRVCIFVCLCTQFRYNGLPYLKASRKSQFAALMLFPSEHPNFLIILFAYFHNKIWIIYERFESEWNNSTIDLWHCCVCVCVCVVRTGIIH